MKKLYLILNLFIFLILIQYNVTATTYHFKWDNTYIEIPVGESLSNYMYMPYATLYYNNQKSLDQDISYLRDGNDPIYILKNVNTINLGIYQVVYKCFAYESGVDSCDGYKQTITFNVVDKTKPLIILNDNNLMISTKNRTFDYTKILTITDNYSSNIDIDVNDLEVKYGTVGIYNVYVNATDESKNTANIMFKVKIVDSEAPIIKYKGSTNKIHLEYGMEFIVSDYFQAYDEIDGDLTSNIIISNFNEYLLGEQTINLKVVDSNGNSESLSFGVVIEDTTKPTIILETTVIDLDYKKMYSKDFFKEKIIEVYDNYSILNIDDVKIDISGIDNKVGIYYVYYSLMDENDLECIEVLQVNMLSFEQPKITIFEAKIEVGEIFNYLDYIIIEDDSDKDILSKLEVIKNTVNNQVPGKYYVMVSVYNSSGLFNNAVINVEVTRNSNTNIVSENVFDYKIIVIIILGVIVIIGGFYIIKRQKKINL